VSSPAIEVRGVTKSFRIYDEKLQSAKERIIRIGRNPYHEFKALHDVSFDVAEGETFALMGHNGSGKSTLLKCLAGTLRPTAGTIRIRGRVAALLELGSGFHPELTGRENIYLNGSILGLPKGQVDKVFDDIVGFAETGEFIDTQVKHYSSGMAARLGFAVAINVEPDILLVDEVLAVGDEAFQRKCLDRIRQFQREGRTILVVSHAADLVRQMAARAAVLDHGELLTVAEPGSAIRVFRDSLARRGIALPDADAEEATAAEAGTADGAANGSGPNPMRDLNKQIELAQVHLEYPGDDDFLEPGQPLAVHVGYRSRRRMDDVVFALELHDQDGFRLLGVNTDVAEQPVEAVDGAGEVVFRFAEVPLLDGLYTISLGIHTLDGGTEFDHLEGQHAFSVMNPTRIQGKVHFPLVIEHHPGAPVRDRPPAAVPR